MKTHYIKIDAMWWERIVDGDKTCEVRRNDRDYQAGDKLVFDVLPSDNNIFPAPPVTMQKGAIVITHVYSGRGMQAGYVALSFQVKEH